MSDPRPVQNGGWLRRRSVALGAVARFVLWSLRRLFSRERLLATLALAAAVVSVPFLVQALGLWGWLWGAAVVAALLLYGLLLLVSFLRVEMSRTRDAESRQRETVLAEQMRLVEEVRSGERGRQELLTAVRASEENQSEALSQALRLGAERIKVLRDDMESRQERAIQGLEARITALDERSRSMAGSLEARVADLRDDLNSATARSALEAVEAMERRLGEPVDDLRQHVERLKREMDHLQREVSGRLASVQVHVDGMAGHVSGLKDELGGRLAGVEGGVEALGQNLAGLRDQFSGRVAEMGGSLSDLNGRFESRSTDFAARMKAVEQGARVLATEILRAERANDQRGDQERLQREATLAEARAAVEQSRAEIEALRASISVAAQDSRLRAEAIQAALESEASNRTADLRAIRAEQARTPALVETSVAELRTILDKKLGPEFESRLEAWRSRLDNEIASAVQQGRTEDQAAAASREARLKAELEALSKEIIRQKSEAASKADLPGIVESSVRTASASLTKAFTTGHTELASRVASSAEDLERRVAARLAAVDKKVKAEQEALRAAIIAKAEAISGEAVKKLESRVAAADAATAKVSAELDKVRAATGEIAAAKAELSKLQTALTEVRAAAAAGPAAKAEVAKIQTSLNEIKTSTAGLVPKAELEKIQAALTEVRAAAAAGPAAKAEVAKIQTSLNEIKTATAGFAPKAELEKLQTGLTEVRASAAAGPAAKAEVAKVAASLEALKSSVAGGQGAAPEALAALQQTVAAVEAKSNTSVQALRKLSDSNASFARPFDRLLAMDKVKRFESHWLRTFGLNMHRTALGYLAHKICLLEDRGQGRIAAPIETIVMRQLALRSLANRERLEVMEIGTLFGLGAAVMYNFRGSRSSGMNLTLIDPLEGYYEAGAADPTTGVEVCEPVLRENLARLDVPEEHYRLIKALSSDPKAIAAASDRHYDLILVDGDHSTAGIAADFENYGPLVKPGGLIIFDDYGVEQWPGIQPYVDETVRADPDWVWIGADYRTAILAKKADGATAKIRAPASRPTKARTASTKPAPAKRSSTTPRARRT